MEVDSQLFESGADAPALLEPADALLDHGADLVEFAIELHASVVGSLLVGLVRNHRPDAMRPEPVAHAVDAEGLVAGQMSRSPPGWGPIGCGMAIASISDSTHVDSCC